MRPRVLFTALLGFSAVSFIVRADGTAPLNQSRPETLILYKQGAAERITIVCVKPPTRASAGAPLEIECDVKHERVFKSKPPTEGEMIAAEQKAQREAAADTAGFWRKTCGANPPTTQGWGDAREAAWRLVTQACATKDVHAFFVGMRAVLLVESRTCKVDSSNGVDRFKQLDANTWQETSGPLPFCNTTIIRTLSRPAATPASEWWQMRDVTTNATTTGTVRRKTADDR